MIIPSIDLMDGKAVQLIQGKTKVLERSDVENLARKFNLYGEIAVIDLDAALGRGNNEQLIKKLAKSTDVRVGGGIRTVEKANRILQSGAKKIVIGTRASPDFLTQFNPEQIIAAVDSKDDKLVTHGWTQKSDILPREKVEELESYCSEFLYTDINREGMEQGIDLRKIIELRKLTQNDFTYAGGISTAADILNLENENINSQIGMSLYRGNINLQDTFIKLLKFNMVPLNKSSPPLIPTIVQDLQGRILMQAYSSEQSLREALTQRRGTYFSRSRQEIWKKGDTSGNTQELIKTRYDCDRDSLVFTVKQVGGACHLGSYSCFSSEFSLKDLYDVIQNRIEQNSPNSYTSKIASDELRLKEKILEEAGEVVDYSSRENLIWEIADLSYFLMTLMAVHEIRPDEILCELRRRRK